MTSDELKSYLDEYLPPRFKVLAVECTPERYDITFTLADYNERPKLRAVVLNADNGPDIVSGFLVATKDFDSAFPPRPQAGLDHELLGEVITKVYLEEAEKHFSKGGE